MKHLFLNCNSINEYADDYADIVHVKLTDEDVERILMLCDVIKKAGTYKISEFWDADYYCQYHFEDAGIDELTEEALADVEPERTDLDMIHVVNRYDDVYGVMFSTIPKHMGDSDKLMTDFIDINDLLKHNVINQIEL